MMKSFVPLALGAGSAAYLQNYPVTERVLIGGAVSWLAFEILNKKSAPTPPIHTSPPKPPPKPPVHTKPPPHPPVHTRPPTPPPTHPPTCEDYFEKARQLVHGLAGNTKPGSQLAYEFLQANPAALSGCGKVADLYKYYYLRTLHDFYSKAFVYNGDQWQAFSELWMSARETENKSAERGVAQAFIDANFINLFEGDGVAATWRDKLWQTVGNVPAAGCYLLHPHQGVQSTAAVSFPASDATSCASATGSCETWNKLMLKGAGECLYGTYKKTS